MISLYLLTHDLTTMSRNNFQLDENYDPTYRKALEDRLHKLVDIQVTNEGSVSYETTPGPTFS